MIHEEDIRKRDVRTLRTVRDTLGKGFPLKISLSQDSTHMCDEMYDLKAMFSLSPAAQQLHGYVQLDKTTEMLNFRGGAGGIEGDCTELFREISCGILDSLTLSCLGAVDAPESLSVLMEPVGEDLSILSLTHSMHGSCTDPQENAGLLSIVYAPGDRLLVNGFGDPLNLERGELAVFAGTTLEKVTRVVSIKSSSSSGSSSNSSSSSEGQSKLSVLHHTRHNIKPVEGNHFYLTYRAKKSKRAVLEPSRYLSQLVIRNTLNSMRHNGDDSSSSNKNSHNNDNSNSSNSRPFNGTDERDAGDSQRDSPLKNAAVIRSNAMTRSAISSASAAQATSQKLTELFKQLLPTDAEPVPSSSSSSFSSSSVSAIPAMNACVDTSISPIIMDRKKSSPLSAVSFSPDYADSESVPVNSTPVMATVENKLLLSSHSKPSPSALAIHSVSPHSSPLPFTNSSSSSSGSSSGTMDSPFFGGNTTADDIDMEQIIIRVQDEPGDEYLFKIHPSTALRKLLMSYAARVSKNVTELSLYFNGAPINIAHSAAYYHIGDGHVVEVFSATSIIAAREHYQPTSPTEAITIRIGEPGKPMVRVKVKGRTHVWKIMEHYAAQRGVDEFQLRFATDKIDRLDPRNNQTVCEAGLSNGSEILVYPLTAVDDAFR